MNTFEILQTIPCFVVLLALVKPLGIFMAKVSQGVNQNFSAYKSVPLVQSTGYDKPKMDDKGDPIKDAKGNQVVENVNLFQANAREAQKLAHN